MLGPGAGIRLLLEAERSARGLLQFCIARITFHRASCLHTDACRRAQRLSYNVLKNTVLTMLTGSWGSTVQTQFYVCVHFPAECIRFASDSQRNTSGDFKACGWGTSLFSGLLHPSKDEIKFVSSRPRMTAVGHLIQPGAGARVTGKTENSQLILWSQTSRKKYQLVMDRSHSHLEKSRAREKTWQPKPRQALAWDRQKREMNHTELCTEQYPHLPIVKVNIN